MKEEFGKFKCPKCRYSYIVNGYIEWQSREKNGIKNGYSKKKEGEYISGVLELGCYTDDDDIWLYYEPDKCWKTGGSTTENWNILEKNWKCNNKNCKFSSNTFLNFIPNIIINAQKTTLKK